jgi:hypothetical protein
MSQEIMYRKIKFPHYDNLGISHPNTYYNLIKNLKTKLVIFILVNFLNIPLMVLKKIMVMLWG